MTGDKTNPAPMSDEQLRGIRNRLQDCLFQDGEARNAIFHLVAEIDRLRSRDGVGDEEVAVMMNKLIGAVGNPPEVARQFMNEAAALIERLSSSLAAERGARDELSFDNSELRTENDDLRARLRVARAEALEAYKHLDSDAADHLKRTQAMVSLRKIAAIKIAQLKGPTP